VVRRLAWLFFDN